MTQKPAVVALSSCEAEYYAVAETCRENIPLCILLEELGHPQIGPTTIYEDNKSAIALTEYPHHYKKVKHFDIKSHFIRQQQEDKLMKATYLPTDDQVADLMTKALPEKKFRHFRSMLLVFP